MRTFARAVTWINGNPTNRRRLCFTYVVIALVAVCSLGWQVNGWPHELVAKLCAYRANDLGTWRSFRMLGGAFLLPSATYALQLPAVIAVLIAVERRMGFWYTTTSFFLLHVLTTVIVGAVMHAAKFESSLSNLDVGTSVMMVGGATFLATITKSGLLWYIVGIGVGIDILVNSNLASVEHLLTVLLGFLIGITEVHFRTPIHITKTQ